MIELFRKYLDNQCSLDEVKELLQYFNIPDNEALLREMILETLEEEKAEESGDLWPQRKFDGEIQRDLNLSRVIKIVEKKPFTI